MSIQLNKLLFLITILSFFSTSYSGEAVQFGDEISDIQDAVINFITSFLMQESLEKIHPSIRIGSLCVAAAVLVILFRVLIFFMIVCGILFIMLGSPKKATDYLKQKFNFIKVKSGN